MKKLLLSVCLIFCFSCSENIERTEELNISSEKVIERLSKEYNCKMKPLEKLSKHLIVKNINELEQLLKSIQKNTNAIVIKTIGIDQPNSSRDTLQILNNVSKTKLLIANFQSVVNTKSNVTFDEPDYQYSQTFYFNNSYPTQNVAVTISYNMTYSGIITAASVSTSTWGNSFGSTWTQTSATVGFYGGLIWFSVNGTYTAALGIGSWSLTSANAVQFTGDMYYLPERGKASLAGACSQRPIF